MIAPGDSGHIAAHNNRGLDVTLPPYGAAGDGVTDDTSAWTRAITDLEEGQTLFAPAGASFLLDTVPLSKPLIVYAYGATFVSESAPLRAGADGVKILGATFADTAGGTQAFGGTLTDGAYTRWLLRDCVFDGVASWFQKVGRDDGDGNVQTTGTGHDSLIRLESCEWFGVEAMFTLGLWGVSDVAVRDPNIHDTGIDIDQGDGIKILHGATRVLLDGGVIDSPTRDCIDTHNGGRVTVRGMTLRNAGANAIDAKWVAAGTTETGLLIVDGCRAEDCGFGFNVDAPKGRIVGNVCERSGAYGFRASQSVDSSQTATEHVAFVGNLADGCDGDGFVFSNGSGFTLFGNHAIDNGAFGYSKGAGVGVKGGEDHNVADGNESGGFNGFS